MTALAVVPQTADLMTLEDLGHQVGMVQQAMKLVMKQETHYGVIPGVQKPSLWKPGAEVLISLFNLDVDFIETKAVDEPTFILREYKCVITHPNGRKRAALGSCSSREKKYGYRTANRKCPACSKEAIFKSKDDRGGWFCWKKKEGCGAIFRDGTKEIESQEVGSFPIGEAVWEQHNTIVKMAQKRALIAAVLNATAASDIFTQDVEDFAEYMAPPKGFDTKPDAIPQDKAAVEAHGGAAAADAAAADVENRAPKGLLDKLAKHFDWLDMDIGASADWLAERWNTSNPEHLSKEQVTQAIAELERDVAAAMPPDAATNAQSKRFHAAARKMFPEPRADLYKGQVQGWLMAMFQVRTTKFLTEKTMSDVITAMENGEMPGGKMTPPTDTTQDVSPDASAPCDEARWTIIKAALDAKGIKAVAEQMIWMRDKSGYAVLRREDLHIGDARNMLKVLKLA